MNDPIPVYLAPQEYDPAVPIGALHEHPENYNEGADEALAASLDAHGFYDAVLVQRSTGAILAGNSRYRASVAKGAQTLPAFWLDVDDDEARRILAHDNVFGRLAVFDEAKLVALLTHVQDDTGSTAGTGYSDDDLAGMIRLLGGGSGQDDDDGDPDDIPPVPVEPITQRGDLWRLGPHRLLCGDGTDADDVERATAGQNIGIVYTDPPYGINIVSGNRRGRKRSAQSVGGGMGGFGTIGTGAPFGGKKGRGGKFYKTTEFLKVTGDDSTDTARAAFGMLSGAYPDAVHVWWGGNHYVASAGLPDSSCWLVWDKNNGGNDFADAELAWTSHKGAVRLLQHTWNGMLRASESGKRVHPNQKPVAVAEWAFGVVDAKHERTSVLDVFAGSGSTLIAAHRTQRAGVMIEVEPSYCDLICRRFEDFTGITPELETRER